MDSWNHDNLIQNKKLSLFSYYSCIRQFSYLCDSGIEFEGLKIWGTPWTPTFQGINPLCTEFTCSTAFTYSNETWFYDEKVIKIPSDIDILISHGPSRGILDRTLEGKNVGSTALEAYLKYIGRPKLHVFGHIHEAYGVEEVYAGHNDTMVKSINCSHLNAKYEPVNNPYEIEL
ncbi:MAG TPA: hypothetical protein VKZ95_08690 [Sphingobacteriaceae bacterium]|nr:hypothetical protein [Sphingobacteriaceae bacterium]